MTFMVADNLYTQGVFEMIEETSICLFFETAKCRFFLKKNVHLQN
jgi:hypothetical protein